MRRPSFNLYFCLSLISATLIFSNINAQQVFKTTKASVIGYLEYVPADYHSNSKDYPVVIFLHGKGEKGPKGKNAKELEKGVSQLTKIGPPRHVKNGTKFPFILISPQLKADMGDWPSAYVMEVIEHVKTYLRVDEKRIYLTGLSLGGGGTWNTAQDYPNYFAAIAPVCGSRNSTGKACKLAESNVGVWAFHGNKDNVIPHGRSANMVNAINGCSPKVKAKLTTYPGVAHNAWDKAYNPTHDIHNPNVYDWMLTFVNDGNNAPSNQTPAVNAGTDKTITLPTNAIELVSTCTDGDGSITAHSWTKVSGGKATLKGANTNKLNASDLEVGSYVFRITATDNDGANKSDDVTVTVKASADKNAAPRANAGADITITLPNNTVELHGSGTDSDGKISTFTWIKVSGPNAILKGTNAAKMKASSLVTGSYVFRLTVKDNKNATHADDVIVTVKAANAKNSAPKANAGPDKTITLPTNSVVLAGSATDSDGKIASFAWAKVSGPNASLSSATAASVTVSNLTQGRYVFRLTAKDDKGASHADDVIIVVNEAAKGNTAPVANAGSDRILTLPTNSVTLTGSATDADGRIVSFSWAKVRGGAANLQGANTPTLSVTNLKEGIYYFVLVVKDDKGAVDEDKLMVIVNKGKNNTSRTAAASIASSSLFEVSENNLGVEEESGNENLVNAEEEEFELADSDVSKFRDVEIVVYNEKLQRVYSGAWHNNSYSAVFNQTGLYFYNVLRNGKKINTGKLYIR